MALSQSPSCNSGVSNASNTSTQDSDTVHKTMSTLLERMTGIEKRLDGIAAMPKQLNTLLDSLTHLHVQLESRVAPILDCSLPGQNLAAVDDAASVISPVSHAPPTPSLCARGLSFHGKPLSVHLATNSASTSMFSPCTSMCALSKARASASRECGFDGAEQRTTARQYKHGSSAGHRAACAAHAPSIAEQLDVHIDTLAPTLDCDCDFDSQGFARQTSQGSSAIVPTPRSNYVRQPSHSSTLVVPSPRPTFRTSKSSSSVTSKSSEKSNHNFCLASPKRHRLVHLSSVGTLQDLMGEDQNDMRCYVMPNSSRLLLWDTLIIISTVVGGFVVPFGLVYHGVRDLTQSGSSCFLHIADVLWALDIICSFRTAYFCEDTGQLVAIAYRVARRYARTYLAMDLLAAWPLAFLPVDMGNGICYVFFAVRSLRLLRLGPRFAKLQRELRCEGKQTGVLVVKVCITILLLSHTMACVWRVVQHADGVIDDQSASSWDLYVEDAYWVFMTMTTVGYGDIAPQGTLGRLYAIFAMLVASIFFGTIVSALTHITTGLFNSEVEKNVAQCTRFMRSRHVHQELQRRVQYNLRLRLQQDIRSTLDPNLFDLLSPGVQRDLSLSLLQAVVLQFPLFQGTQRSFVAELAQAHSWAHHFPGDLVVEEGQHVREVAFVIRGKLTIRYGRGSQGMHLDVNIGQENMVDCRVRTWPEAEMQEGAWFGESCLFDEERMMVAAIYTLADSELAVLAAPEYLQIVQKYPRLMERHRKICAAIAQGKLKLEQLAYEACCEERREEESTSWTGFRELFRWDTQPHVFA